MKPVVKGEEYTIDIESISSDGNGVGHIDGFAVFVPHSCGGDRVRARVTRVKPRFAYAEITEIIEKSPYRTEVDCPYVPMCGGCQLRHMDYIAELSEKRRIVENAVRRLGGIEDFTLDEIIGADNTARYRNKAVFKLGRVGSETVSGFYSQGSHSVVAVNDCLICDEAFAKIASAAAKYANDSEARIDSVFIRESRKTGEIMTVINTDAASLPYRDTLVGEILDASGRVTGILTDGKHGSRLLYGKDTITEEICGVNFRVSHKSFLQVNGFQTEKLYTKVMDFAEISLGDTVLDIYCGIGTITLIAAKRAKRVIGVEKVKRAIDDAKINAEMNGIQNASFFAKSAEDIVPKLINDGERPQIVILDPPRAGSDEKTLAAILNAKPERIIYVSCNSASLARDLRFLCSDGYAVTASAACDMFPRTMHVETVIRLEKIID